MIHPLPPGAIVYAAAQQDHLLSPGLAVALARMCEYKSTILLSELIHMHPDALVFDLNHLSAVMGTVIIDGVDA